MGREAPSSCSQMRFGRSRQIFARKIKKNIFGPKMGVVYNFYNSKLVQVNYIIIKCAFHFIESGNAGAKRPMGREAPGLVLYVVLAMRVQSAW